MRNLQLTEHFNLNEFERSDKAKACGIDNSIPTTLINNVTNLCKEILEPFRKQFKVPVVITSGYRCPALNLKVGGANNSQHMMGEAADIRIPKTDYTSWDDNLRHTDMEIAERWFNWITTHTDFDQCILETANNRDYWLHVSCRRNKARNRHQAIKYLKKK